MTLDTFAFIQTAPGRVVVGWGPFDASARRDPRRPAFYMNDFFLGDAAPWKHPARWEELPVAELARRFVGAHALAVQWQPPVLSEFEALFSSAHGAIAAGQFDKIVPVVFESGTCTNGTGPPHEYLLSRLASIPDALLCYGWIEGDAGFIGATPEMLFAAGDGTIETVAIAGTMPTSAASGLLRDFKERKEHDYVTTDIVERLAPYGITRVESVEVMELPTISHLRTRIRFEPSGGGEGGETGAPAFDELVRILHPTAALGVWPRNDAGQAWLRRADERDGRRGFGAPFGIEMPDGRGLCLVAIRNVEWLQRRMRIGAGSGVVAESALEREFDELRGKREQVKRLFGITG
ncbi:MAG: chorismate-binding protein [Gemmatimonadaceae bacterium]